MSHASHARVRKTVPRQRIDLSPNTISNNLMDYGLCLENTSTS